jgi:predicted transcriptional regulator
MESEKLTEQRRLYGEPIATLVHRVTGGLGLTQAQVAQVLGLSPSMLSQLVSAHRVKIGNPLAVARLQNLLTLVEEAPTLTGEALRNRLTEIREQNGTLTTGQLTHAESPSTVLRKALHAVASGQELYRAADALDDVAPGLAELIRAYGTGTAADAARHFESIRHLL